MTGMESLVGTPVDVIKIQIPRLAFEPSTMAINGFRKFSTYVTSSCFRTLYQNNTRIEIDLENQTIHLPNGGNFDFHIDPFRKQTLIEGLDDIDLTLKYNQLIKDHETNNAAERPWIATIS